MTSTPQLMPSRYVAPTVTLEVMAQKAAVSHWSDRPVVRILRYQLQIHSPTNAAEMIEIRGDRGSFFPLIEAIQHYIHGQLVGTAPSIERSHSPYLEPQGLTQHRLHLGSLRTAAGTDHLFLSAVQLADLGDVIEQLEATVRPLPVALTPTRRRRAWQPWGAAVAGVVAAIGLTTTLWPDYALPPTSEMGATPDTSTQDAPADAGEDSLTEVAPEASESTAPPPEADDEPVASVPSPASREAPPPAIAPGSPRPAPAGAAASNQSKTDHRETLGPAGASPPDPQPNPESSATAPPDVSGGITAESDPPAPEPVAPATSSNQRALPPATRTPAPAMVEEPPAAAPTTAPGSVFTPSRNQPAPSSAPPEGGDTFGDASPPEPEAVLGVESDEAGQLPSAPSAPEPGSIAALVVKVRDRWQPPSELAQPLIYTLEFTAEGTLSRIVPEDERSAQYQDQAGLPAIGSQELLAGEPRRIQLRLRASGAVEATEATVD